MVTRMSSASLVILTIRPVVDSEFAIRAIIEAVTTRLMLMATSTSIRLAPAWRL